MSILVAVLFVQPLFAAVQDYGLPSTNDVLVKPHFVLSFDKTNKIPRWVAYELSAADLSHRLNRNGKWKKDSEIPARYMASNKDYAKTRYDKGHLVPSADMVRSQQAMQATFTFANCAPQAQMFNRGEWNKLEMRVRKWATKRKNIVVYTGVFFKDRKATNFIGKKVAVPEYWFKVVYDPSKDDAVCFVGSNSPTNADMKQVKISELESLTGLDFLSKLPADQQNKIENRISSWR